MSGTATGFSLVAQSDGKVMVSWRVDLQVRQDRPCETHEEKFGSNYVGPCLRKGRSIFIYIVIQMTKLGRFVIILQNMPGESVRAGEWRRLRHGGKEVTVEEPMDIGPSRARCVSSLRSPVVELAYRLSHSPTRIH